MSAVEAEKKAAEEMKVEEKGGELLFCGSTCWSLISRMKGAQEGNLVSPTRLRPLVGVDIRVVASGSASFYCVALDVEGRCYTWGRNERGQLGHGDTIPRDRPTVVSELSKYKLIRAGAGRSHSVVVTEDGLSLAFGWNKHGQLGSGSARNEIESSPVRCLVSDVKTTACGADFTVWLSSVEGASILSAGLPQYGQLGHGTDKEYNTKDSSVRLAYEAQPCPRAIASLAGKTIVKVACGTNHTVAVDSNGYVYTWGFGGYGRLGHKEQKDEWVPRRVDIFSKHNVLPPGAIISAGSMNSACTAGGGQLYMWGKIKNTGDDWMYPKPLMDLSGWNLRCMDSGNMHHFVGADSSCVSWGHARNGELGYGPNGQKSSAVPKKVDILEGMHVIGVACGTGHSMVIVDRTNVGDGLDQLDVYDGKASDEGSGEPGSKDHVKQSGKKGAAKATDNSRKRKSKDASESEEENSNDESIAGDEVNGQTEKKSIRGGKVSGTGQSTGGKKSSSAGKSTGRGQGRHPSANKSTNSSLEKTGKRGRPHKS
ncbi:protein RCC2 [Populus alba x Populus x berolinensis]|nr:protein RCC2 [Populus alba x Populus x berolinensis]